MRISAPRHGPFVHPVWLSLEKWRRGIRSHSRTFSPLPTSPFLNMGSPLAFNDAVTNQSVVQGMAYHPAPNASLLPG